MTDPFLLAHQVVPRLFDLSGRIYPINIRDQMVRGRLVIDRAIENRLIAPDDKVLVIGAGAAGATAGIRAAQRGHRTLLVELAPAPFLRQAACQTRWLDPTQYDWPVGHWSEARYPWMPPAMPLPWLADWSHNLAIRWTTDLNAAMRQFPQLHLLYQTTVAPLFGILRLANGLFQVQLTPPSPFHPNPVVVAMIVLTIGFGTERCSAGHYQGFPFWATEDLQKNNCGLPASSPARILISGAGDGALQDFLRIVTRCNSAEEIYRRCNIPVDIERDVQHAEDRAQRAYAWGETDHHDHPVQELLHRAHLAAALRALQNQGVQNALENLVRTPPDIVLAHACSHFSNCYGLNRFLVLLIAEYVARHLPHHPVRRQLLWPKVRVDRVRASTPGHTCVGIPAACHGQDHTVTFVEYPDCRGAAGAAIPQSLDRNVIVIRHGVNSSGWPGLPPIAHPRQILPYHVTT